jgi:hypothetical protein
MRRVPVTVLTFVVLMLLPPAATAASGADPSNPSLDQYVESVPSSHGGPPPGQKSNGHTTRGHLSASVRRRIARQGGNDAQQLEAVATSPTFGAPVTSATPRTSGGSGANGAASGGQGAGGGSSGTHRAPLDAGGRAPSGLDAFTTAATHGDGSSTSILLVGALLIAALAGGTALARRREHRA